MTGTSEGVKKAWDKRGRGRKRQTEAPGKTDTKAIAEKVKSNKPVTRSEYASLKAEAIPKTPEFKKWFADSKVVDKDGIPQVVYHGSTAVGFNEFKTKFDQRGKNETSGLGAWFTNNPDVAKAFTEGEHYEGKWPEGKYIENPPRGTYPVYLSLQNPKIYEPSPPIQATDYHTGKPAFQKERHHEYDEYGESKYTYVDTDKPEMWSNDPLEQLMDDRDEFTRYGYEHSEYGTDKKNKTPRGYWRTSYANTNTLEANEAFVNKLKSQGHDGIILKDTVYDAGGNKQTTMQYVVFEPNQVKSIFNKKPTGSSIITNAGTSEGVKKGWQKRKRAKPEITSDIKSDKTITKSEYKQIKSELLASPLPSVENRNVDVTDDQLAEIQKRYGGDPSRAYDSTMSDPRQDSRLYEIAKLKGFTGKPKVVSDEELEAYAKENKVDVMYRGVSDGRHAEAFKNGDYWAGKGLNGNGTYCAYGAEGKNLAKKYIPSEIDNINYEATNLMKMCLTKDAKIIDYDDILKNQSKFIDKFPKSRSLLSSDEGKIAAAMGYDAIRLPPEDGDPYKEGSWANMIVLNRSKVMVVK